MDYLSYNTRQKLSKWTKVVCLVILSAALGRASYIFAYNGSVPSLPQGIGVWYTMASILTALAAFAVAVNAAFKASDL